MSEDQGAIALVNEKFNDSRGYASTAFANANALLSSLASKVYTASIAPVDTNIDITLYDPALPQFVKPTWDIKSVDDAPDAPGLTVIPKFSSTDTAKFKTDFPEEPKEVDLLEIPKMDFPSTPTFSGSLNLPSFSIDGIISQASSILNSLQNSLNGVGEKLLSFIYSPTQAIGDAVVTAMSDAAMQRIDDDFDSKQNEVMTFFSSRGWNTPQGVLHAKLEEFNRLHIVQKSNIERDILIKNFELSQQNFQASLQAYVQLTQVNNSLLLGSMQQLYEAARYAVEFAIARFNALATKYKVDTEVYKITTEESIQKTMAILEENKGLISIYGAEIQAFTGKINAISAYNSTIAQTQDIKIKAYATELQGITAGNAALVQSYSNDIQKFSANVQAIINETHSNIQSAQLELQSYDIASRSELSKAEVYAKNAQTQISAFSSSTQLAISQVDMELKNMATMASLATEVAKASAQIAAQLCASSLSAVSAGASVGYTTHANYDETKSTVSTQINLTGPAPA